MKNKLKFTPLEERIVLDAALAATVIYVNASAHAGGDGSSWAHAYNSLQDALTKAANTPGPDQIWIAVGTYKPSQIYSPNGVTGGAAGLNTAQMETFNLPNNVTLYGGFLPGQTLSQRDPSLHQTILEGNLGNGVDVYHVVTLGNDVAKTGVTATLDGVTIQDGNAMGPDSVTAGAINYSYESGGGIYANFASNLTLNDVVVKNNEAALAPENNFVGSGGVGDGGGGLAALDNSNITINNSTFSNDIAGNATSTQGQGGAIYIANGGTATIKSSTFSNDSATTNGGAIATDYTGLITLQNDVFNNNATTGPFAPYFGSGGAVNVFDSSLNVTGTSFTGNSSMWSAAALGLEFQADAASSHQVTINNTTFTNNHGAFEGSITITSLGAANPLDMVTINNTVFKGNYGGGTGGGIDIDSINTNINNDTFIDNTSAGVGGAINSDDFFNNTGGTPLTTVNVTNTSFVGNTSQGNLAQIAAYVGAFSSPAFGAVYSPGGGAVSSIWGSQINISNSSFVGNTAQNGGDGGAILSGGANLYASGFDFATGSTVTLNNDSFVGNASLKGNGGAIANESTVPLGYVTGSPTVAVHNSQIVGNVAALNGGAYYTNQSDNTIAGNSFLLNFAHNANEVYGINSNINGEATSSPTAAHDLALANSFYLLNSDDIQLA